MLSIVAAVAVTAVIGATQLGGVERQVEINTHRIVTLELSDEKSVADRARIRERMAVIEVEMREVRKIHDRIEGQGR